MVAYNQPVTRSFIEQVRGVDSSSVVASLEEKGLIEEAGRMELPGRPVAFRTTAAFLRCFGLSDLSELPELQPPEEAEETEEEEQLGFDDLTPEEENDRPVDHFGVAGAYSGADADPGRAGSPLPRRGLYRRRKMAVPALFTLWPLPEKEEPEKAGKKQEKKPSKSQKGEEIRAAALYGLAAADQ